ncbi:MAG: restriction endonuclease subunit S [Ruminococcus sp.]|nr:restriction endonuclease subunit S [Ruminococcus sp.]
MKFNGNSLTWDDLITLEYGKPISDKNSTDGKVPIFGTNGKIGTSHLTSLCKIPSFIVGRKGAYRGVHYSNIPFSVIDTAFYAMPISDELDMKWAYYKFLTYDINRMNSGSAIPSTDRYEIYRIPVTLPPVSIQKRIVSILDSISDKITLNNAINENLEHQAQAIFDSFFSDISNGNTKIGDYITPKRGKSLLSKNAITGNVPVVAGGLEPATYHNIANTKAPVLTISASGANAGFVNLWHIPIWSSDSSFIDSNMTNHVYFWYILLKKRQKEIFDSQTGSAQPHIYPKHITIMPIKNIHIDDIKEFTDSVTFLFKLMGNNKKENQRLSALRDTLLPKLMNGEIDVSKINI